MTDSTSSSPRNRGGAPKGNKNALGHGAPPRNRNAARHGLYAKYFTRDECIRLDNDRLGKLQDEENSLSIIMSRIFATMDKRETDHLSVLNDARVIALVGGRIESIHRSRKVVYENLTAMEQAMDELKYLPVDVD
jgi:hypothetical protein